MSKLSFVVCKMRRLYLPYEVTPARVKSRLQCMKMAFEEVGLDEHPLGEVSCNG